VVFLSLAGGMVIWQKIVYLVVVPVVTKRTPIEDAEAIPRIARAATGLGIGWLAVAGGTAALVALAGALRGPWPYILLGTGLVPIVVLPNALRAIRGMKDLSTTRNAP
jgi:hypothetical protein